MERALARNLPKYEQSPLQAPAYDVSFDTTAIENGDPLARERIRRNLQTLIGEAFNAQISQVQYEVRDGKLWSSEHNCAFEDVIRGGIRERQKYPNNNDRLREEAELEGFLKVQEIFSSPTTSRATRIIIASPKGDHDSVYQLSFFDEYHKETNGAITMTRHASKMTRAEFAQAAREIDPNINLSQNATDADFLKSPTVTFRSKAELHSLYLKDEDAMQPEEFQKLLTQLDAPINYFLAAPSKSRLHSLINVAADLVQNNQNPNVIPISRHQSYVPQNLPFIFEAYAAQPLKVKTAGCGLFESGRQTANFLGNIFQSVSEFDLKLSEDELGTLEINCEECGKTYQRTPGKLEEECRYCHGTKGIVC